MALLSTMVERIAEVAGVETANASGIARYLRESGLLTQAGRGRGAAHMSSEDAARFIIGLNTAVTAKDASDAVRLFCDLRNIWKAPSEFSGVCFEGQSLLSAMVGLLEICGREELRKKIESTDLEIQIYFNRPVPHVYINIDLTAWDEFGVPDTRPVARGLYGSTSGLVFRSVPDRLETVLITQRTLLVAADVIAA